jgi:putative DNA primase/helicase
LDGGSGRKGLGGGGSGHDKRRGSSAFDYTRDDIGNAQRIVAAYGEDLKFIPGLGGWHCWDGTRWRSDKTGQPMRWAMEMVRGMGEESEFIEDLKEKAAFAAFIRSSGMAGKIRAMLELASGMRGMRADAEEFDADPRLLLTPNGVLELKDDGATFRPVSREDKITKISRAEYDPAAHSADWEKFLARSMPDEALRHWTQKALGYSMYGRNPGRHLFMVPSTPVSRRSWRRWRTRWGSTPRPSGWGCSGARSRPAPTRSWYG